MNNCGRVSSRCSQVRKCNSRRFVDFTRLGRRWINAIYTPTLDADGALDGWVGVIVDNTERRQVEEALRRSEERFARFMQFLPGSAWIKDLSGRYVYANDAAVAIFNRYAIRSMERATAKFSRQRRLINSRKTIGRR